MFVPRGSEGWAMLGLRKAQSPGWCPSGSHARLQVPAAQRLALPLKEFWGFYSLKELGSYPKSGNSGSCI